MIRHSFRKTAVMIIRQLLLVILLVTLAGCGTKDTASANDSDDWQIEENQRDNKTTYPYVVHTESSTWYLAADDIALLGEEAYYAGLKEILQDVEPDFADAREALAGYLPEEIPPVDIFTDFCGKAGISEIAGAYYNPRSNFIKLFSGWDMAKEALLHEYVHYLTMHCAETPAVEGFWAEGIAEYVSKLVCKNRMLRSVNMGFSDEEAQFYKERGAWDNEEDCIDPKLFYYGTAQIIAQGQLVGTDYFSVSDVTITRTPQIQQNPRPDKMSHIEAACIMAYLIETYSEDLVLSSLDSKTEEMETIFGKPFNEIYTDWTEWNTGKFEELGLIN